MVAAMGYQAIAHLETALQAHAASAQALRAHAALAQALRALAVLAQHLPIATAAGIIPIAATRIATPTALIHSPHNPRAVVSAEDRQ